jgi:hypothetical protein
VYDLGERTEKQIKVAMDAMKKANAVYNKQFHGDPF